MEQCLEKKKGRTAALPPFPLERKEGGGGKEGSSRSRNVCQRLGEGEGEDKE